MSFLQALQNTIGSFVTLQEEGSTEHKVRGFYMHEGKALPFTCEVDFGYYSTDTDWFKIKVETSYSIHGHLDANEKTAKTKVKGGKLREGSRWSGYKSTWQNFELTDKQTKALESRLKKIALRLDRAIQETEQRVQAKQQQKQLEQEKLEFVESFNCKNIKLNSYGSVSFAITTDDPELLRKLKAVVESHK